MAEIKVRGLPELRVALRELPMRLQQNAMRIAIQAAAKVLAQEVAAAAPVWAGYLSPKRQMDRPRGALRASVLARRRRARRGEVRSEVSMKFYGRYLELGWNLTGRKPAKKVIRKIAPRPFVEPAFQRARDRAVEAFADVVRRELVNQPLKAQARARNQLARMINDMYGDGGQ